MTTQEYVKILRERWLTVGLAIILSVGAGIAFLMLRPPEYTATIQMYVSSPGVGPSDPSALSAAQLAQSRVKSYQELATSPKVLSAAISSSGVSTSADELAGRVSATTADSSVVIAISVVGQDPVVAARTADAIGSALSSLVDSLERPAPPAAGPASVTVRAVESAPIPTGESLTSSKRIIAIAVFAGLAIGVGLALARNAADSSIQSPEQLSQIMGTSNLGSITLQSAVTKHSLTLLEEPNSAAAEDYRRLRTTLQFIEADKEHKVLLMCSALPSEGKTTTAINVAAALALAGYRTLLVDADLRRPMVAEKLLLSSEPGLTNVLAGRIGLLQAIQTSAIPKLDVLSSGTLPPNPSELLASAQNSRLIEQVRQRYDVTLIDSPPILPVSDTTALAPLTDAALLLCRSNLTSIADARRVAAALRAVECRIGGSILIGGAASGRGLSGLAYGYRYRPSTSLDHVAQDQVVATDASEPASQFSERVQHRRPRPYPAQVAPGPNDLGAETEQMKNHWNGHT